MSNDQDLTAILDRQHRSLLQNLPITLATRRDRLQRLIKLLAGNAGALAAAMDRDFGGRCR